MIRSPLMSFASTTVPALVTFRSPFTVVSDVPAGTPVFAAVGKQVGYAQSPGDAGGAGGGGAGWLDAVVLGLPPVGGAVGGAAVVVGAAVGLIGPTPGGAGGAGAGAPDGWNATSA